MLSAAESEVKQAELLAMISAELRTALLKQ